MNRLSRDCAIATLFALVVAGPAFAHAHLTSATPPPGGNVAAPPSQLTLTFSESLSLAFTSAKLTGPNGNDIATGKEKLKSSSDRTLIVPLSSTLAPGSYTVDWKALSRDGHKTHGTYRFTIGGE